MGIFSSIWNKITGHKPKTAPAPSPTVGGAPPTPGAAPIATAAPVLPPVEVDEVHIDMDQSMGGGGNWRTSIVDLLKLLDLDSSLAARKELAEELNVHAGEHGSAEQNTALSRAVWNKLAENGGQVPASLRD
jgi:hypothetical protein